jgi:hypothetical protein
MAGVVWAQMGGVRGLGQVVVKVLLHEARDVPQRLKPRLRNVIYGTAEAVPLSKTVFWGTSQSFFRQISAPLCSGSILNEFHADAVSS